MAHEKEPDGSERRRHQRVHTRIEIPYWKYVKVKHKREVNIGFVKNISKGGFFIESEMVHARGEQVGFEFYLPNSPQAVQGMAKVAWSKGDSSGEADPENPPGMGLEFQEFEGEGESILMEFIESEIRKGKPTS